MSKKKQKLDKPQNFVHKYMEIFNHSATHVDRKKESKKGKIKHKGQSSDSSFSF